MYADRFQPTGNHVADDSTCHAGGIDMLLFEVGDYHIRCPKRAGGYAAQLWGLGGFWSLGTFASIREARTAARLFAADDPVEPDATTPRELWPANWVRRRCRVDDPAGCPNWVRRVKGGAYQARFWLEVVGGSLNLGLFTLAEHDGDWRMARWAAARASKGFRDLWTGSRTVGECVAILQAKRPLPWVPPHVEVPAKWAGLTLPKECGPIGFAHERRARRQRERDLRDYPLTVWGQSMRWVLTA